ncbi:MAG: slipin family protein [Candidatus Micrarchaeota archaeon]|nr:slipin family protein [Candidatus Micrarchaeota archaeon]
MAVTRGSSGLAIGIWIIVLAIFGIGTEFLSGFDPLTTGAVLVFVFLVYLAMSIRVLPEWKRSPVLTLGRYTGIYGPGIFFLVPLAQTTPYTFDLRTLSATFSAEKTLTSDNVTVDVDAIMFSRIEDPEKTALQVTDVEGSVTLAAQTALRDIIGQVDLSHMIQGRSEIADEVKKLIDDRVLPWGVNVISVEIRDVRIPAELQDAMARVAVASRERDARVVLAESEKLAAQRMVDAANIYQSNLFAMQLRSLNIMYEIGISGRNNIIFVPTDSKGIGFPTPLGVFGLNSVMSGNLNVGQQDQKGQGQAAQKPKKPSGTPQG